jgi:hypothetical protein
MERTTILKFFGATANLKSLPGLLLHADEVADFKHTGTLRKHVACRKTCGDGIVIVEHGGGRIGCFAVCMCNVSPTCVFFAFALCMYVV